MASDKAQLQQWKEEFCRAGPVEGRLTGRQAKGVMMASRLPNSVLSKIWALSDMDRNGVMDEEEFCLAMYLIQYKVGFTHIRQKNLHPNMTLEH